MDQYYSRVCGYKLSFHLFKLIPKQTSGSQIKALKLSPKDVRNLNKATSVEGYGDKVITDEY